MHSQTRLVTIVFFLSGASALSYEVIWSRTLQAIFSSNYQTAAAIFSAFMLGFALGAYALGKFSDKTKHSLLYLSLLMLFIGVYGFFTAFAFVWLGSLDWLVSANQFIRLLTVLILILPASLSFGAVWPLVMASVVQKNKKTAQRIGNLYSLNSLGSGLGALLSGVALIPLVGFRGSSLIIASINILLAGLLYRQHLKKTKSWPQKS